MRVAMSLFEGRRDNKSTIFLLSLAYYLCLVYSFFFSHSVYCVLLKSIFPLLMLIHLRESRPLNSVLDLRVQA